MARAQPPPEHEVPQSAPPEPVPPAEQSAPPSTAPEAAPTAGAEEAPPKTSSIDVHASSEVAVYGDDDHVFVVTPTIAGTVSSPTAGWSVDARYLVDVVSAASVDIVSAASRRWEEVRHAGTLNATYKPGDWGISVNGDVSSEPDYLSLSGGFAVTRDMFDKNVTALLGFNYGHDVAGRTGTPFSVYSKPLDRYAFKAGLTFVLSPATIASIVGDVIVESGDPSKPYRYVPLFAPGVYVPLGASVDLVTQLRASERPAEQLPTSRDRFALSGRLAHRFSGSTLRLDERLYGDSWSLFATTTDARYLIDVSRRFTFGPHVRFHGQTSVNFWQRAYVMLPGNNYPALRTGDRELGPLLNFTGGLTARWKIGPEENPGAWSFGFDVNGTSTQYLDDIYLKSRLSAIGAISLEGEL